MKKVINLNKWEFNYLDIVDPKENGQYYYYFKFFLSNLLNGVDRVVSTINNSYEGHNQL